MSDELQDFTVEVVHSIRVDVTVRARNAREVIEKVDRKDFELPPRDEWTGDDDWVYTVSDDTGKPVMRMDGIEGVCELDDDETETTK